MRFLTFSSSAVILASCFLLSGCGATTSTSNARNPRLAAYQNFDAEAKLPENRSAVEVKVSLRKQAAYVLEDGKPLLIMPVSIGARSTPTPQGNFTILRKLTRHRSPRHGWAYSAAGYVQESEAGAQPGGWKFTGHPLPYWCEFAPGLGFHTGWLKAEPCTRGCLRLHENIAPKFYRLVSNGTPVSIAESQPEDARLGRKVRRPPYGEHLDDYSPALYISDDYFTRHQAPTFHSGWLR
ncbi:L,D-transpeptidase [Roseibacillus ishigakijimensis]|uniref:L,D-transpeptidase n=1 Tax=Roseibacillus ishigakijimensis TaxID=454146 RepID=A0A934RLD2_9BACT|nr:L,D-transpeptidase [Roseibacillus ishigakijimensis]MBK1833857.1 L,D-transpeptidase [Roseibacillus ishigakijimensis]